MCLMACPFDQRRVNGTMKSMSEIGKELDGMMEAGKSVPEMAEFLENEACKHPTLLKGLGTFCKRLEELLTLENLRQWPEKHAALLADIFHYLPYIPPRTTMPCGKKELLLADALADISVPKNIRIHLWRCLVMDGYVLPRYVNGTNWSVPPALYDHPAVRDWLCKTKQQGWEDLRCSDSLLFGNDVFYLFKTEAEKRALKAIEKDLPSSLLMPLSIEGRNLPAKYATAAMAKNAKKTITYLFCNDKTFNTQWSPRKLLFYVCANWNDDGTIPFVELLEKENPGLVKNSLDSFGHDALWYTLYQRDRFNRAPLAARRKMTPLARKLIEFGCDPNRQNSLGLSYNDLTVSE